MTIFFFNFMTKSEELLTSFILFPFKCFDSLNAHNTRLFHMLITDESSMRKNQIQSTTLCNENESMGNGKKVKSESKRIIHNVLSANKFRVDVIVMLWFIFTPEFTIRRLCIPKTANTVQRSRKFRWKCRHTLLECGAIWLEHCRNMCHHRRTLFFIRLVFSFLFVCLLPFGLINSLYCNVTRMVHCFVVFVVVTCARDVMPYSGSFVLYFGLMLCAVARLYCHIPWVFVFVASCLRPNFTVCIWWSVRMSERAPKTGKFSCAIL